MGEPITRITLGEPGEQIRIYFDADEQYAGPIIEHQCKTCGAWWKQDGHVSPCSSAQHMADALERINSGVAKLRNTNAN